MRFSVYYLAFYFELNNHKTDTQIKTKAAKKYIYKRNRYNLITFKPGLELTGF